MEPLKDTQELTTPSGHRVIARTYLTGADKRANRRIILDMSSDGKPTADAIDTAENSLISQVIVSIDDVSEDVVDKVLSLPGADYDFIIDTINEVAAGVDKKKEVTSAGSIKTTSAAAK
jgi:hypothetical protein